MKKFISISIFLLFIVIVFNFTNFAKAPIFPKEKNKVLGIKEKYCINDCEKNGYTECMKGKNNKIKACGYFDEDNCLEWGEEDCSKNELCKKGVCTPVK